MNASIVIVSHGRPEMLQRTLESLANCRRPNATLRTIVVENGYDAGARDVVGKAAPHLNAVWEFEPSQIKSVALNSALQICGSDLVIFFDDDVRVSPESLCAYVEVARAAGPGHFFGGPIQPEYEVWPPDWLRRFLPHSARGLQLPEGRSKPVPDIYFLGFNWAAFGEDLIRCDGFSADFGPGTKLGGGDETFLQWRMRRSGLTGLAVPDALVWHAVPTGRCSPEWVLRRTYGGGFNSGILAEQRARDRGETLNAWRGALKRFRSMTVRGDWARLLSLRSEGRFWLRRTLCWTMAFIAGVRHGRKHRPLEPTNWQGLAALFATSNSDCLENRT